MRSLVTFLAGFIAGMLFLLGLLWTRGSLRPAETVAAAAVPQDSADVPDLIVPVAGVDISRIQDTFSEERGSLRHEAADIMAPRGTPVLAAGEGVIVKLFLSRAGGNTIYQFDPTRTWCYYYAHLERYAAGIAENLAVRQGQVIGYVDSTGNASPEAPHLHFAIFRLGPGKQWWKGTPVNPYPILLRHRH